jgi:hypothetical protein
MEQCAQSKLPSEEDRARKRALQCMQRQGTLPNALARKSITERRRDLRQSWARQTGQIIRLGTL